NRRTNERAVAREAPRDHAPRLGEGTQGATLNEVPHPGSHGRRAVPSEGALDAAVFRAVYVAAVSSHVLGRIHQLIRHHWRIAATTLTAGIEMPDGFAGCRPEIVGLTRIGDIHA